MKQQQDAAPPPISFSNPAYSSAPAPHAAASPHGFAAEPAYQEVGAAGAGMATGYMDVSAQPPPQAQTTGYMDVQPRAAAEAFDEEDV